MSRPTVLYTCGGDQSGWSVLRSLEQVDRYRLVTADADPLAAGIYQPSISARYQVPFGSDPSYVDKILEIVRIEEVQVVFPLSDDEVLALAKRQAEFRDLGEVVVTSSPETVQRANDKPIMTRLVEGLGVSVPMTAGLDDDLGSFPFPVVVRPTNGRGGRDVHFIDDLVELERFRDRLAGSEEPFFVQEFIATKIGQMHMAQAIYDLSHQLKAFFSSRSIRTAYPWGGPARGGVPVRDERLKHLTLKIFEHTGPWFGPVNAEFLYDSKRRDYVFIEVNPRYWGYSFLATAAGLNFPDLSIRAAMGEDLPFHGEYAMDVVTMATNEHVSFTRDMMVAGIPEVDLPVPDFGAVVPETST